MKVGLIGNQNSGKTTLFNYLTGMNAKVGNWPGVTIEKKTGIIKGTNYEIVDLPGIYSLSPYSTEEEISRKFIFEEKPDIIINIIDATSLERSLYLTTQLLELNIRVIVALNMSDLLESKGITINIKRLEEMLKTKVYKISALKETGIEEIIKSIDNNLNNEERQNIIKIYDEDIEDAIFKIENISNIYNTTLKKYKRFIAIKVLEGDIRFRNYKNPEIDNIIKNTAIKYSTDLEETIATQRYKYIDIINKECLQRKNKKINTYTDKIDKILLNKWLSFPIFIVVMFLVYYLSVGVIGNLTVDFISKSIEGIKNIIENILININASKVLISLITDGILSGVGAVLKFIPQLIILFLCITLLETTGYMSRISLLLDNIFRKIGLSGKSLIPFIVGSGCSVPGIMSTRIIEDEKEKQMTTILTPFIPCSAKLPIISLFSGYFFKENSGFISASLYLLSIIIVIISAFLMKKIIYRDIKTTYISELPEYKIPSFKYVIKEVYDKVYGFIKRATTVILICSMILWFLLSFTPKLEYVNDIEKSLLASIGNKISWIFYPILGQNNWGATVSAIQGLVAKEQVVSSMTVISGLSKDSNNLNQIFINNSNFSSFTKSSAYAFVVFNLFSAPCIGAIGAMKKELSSRKKLIKAIAFQTGIAWIIATIIYQIGNRIESKNLSINIVNLLISAIILTVSSIIIIYYSKKRTKHKYNQKYRNNNTNNRITNCSSCLYCGLCNKKMYNQK